jgi:hypothetical protein
LTPEELSMKNPLFQEKLLPRCDGRALDFIKICAALFMVIDHIDEMWLHRSTMLLGLIGRATFPLFCYAIAMALFKIQNGSLSPEEKRKTVRQYLTRLLVLAVASQPFYFFSLGEMQANVIFTLALGVIFADLSYRLKIWQTCAVCALAIFSMLWILPLEFGLAGVMVPSAILLVMRGEKGAWIMLVLLLMLINAGGLLSAFTHHAPFIGWAHLAVIGFCCMLLPWAVLDAARFMRQTGRLLPKYALYVFYPGHLVILRLLAMAFLK